MTSRPFSPRYLPLLLTGLSLVIVSLACGLGAAPEASEPPTTGAADATQAAFPEEPAATEPPVSPPQIIILLPTTTAASSTSQPQPSITESRRLTLEFPPRIRLGEGDIIRLTLEVDDLGNVTPTAAVGGNTVTGQTIEIPNLYETHKVTAEARLDLAGVDVQPSDLISEPLTQGHSVTFYWSIHPQEVGIYRGTIWLYLRFVDRSNGEESRKTVSAQMVEIEAVNLMGLPLGVVRTMGALGSFLGGVLGLPFLEDIVKFLLRRIRLR